MSSRWCLENWEGSMSECLQTGFERHGLPPQRAPLGTVYPLRERLNNVQRLVSGGNCEGLFPDTVCWIRLRNTWVFLSEARHNIIEVSLCKTRGFEGFGKSTTTLTIRYINFDELCKGLCNWSEEFPANNLTLVLAYGKLLMFYSSSSEGCGFECLVCLMNFVGNDEF